MYEAAVSDFITKLGRQDLMGLYNIAMLSLLLWKGKEGITSGRLGFVTRRAEFTASLMPHKPGT
jgi:hypothetical protein